MNWVIPDNDDGDSGSSGGGGGVDDDDDDGKDGGNGITCPAALVSGDRCISDEMTCCLPDAFATRLIQ